MLKALAIFSFYHSFSRRAPISFTHHPWGNSADRCVRSGRWIFFSSHTLEKPSTAKSKRRLSQLLQTAHDSPEESWLDFRLLALHWCLGSAWSSRQGRIWPRTALAQQDFPLGWIPHFSLNEDCTSPSTAFHPSKFPAQSRAESSFSVTVE